MPLRTNMEPQDFFEIFARRKWLILFSFIILMFGATLYCVVVPDQYKAATKMLVIPPAVSESLVRSTMNYNVQERLESVREQVLSRARLLQVIDQTGLFPAEKASMTPDALAKKMQNRIKIDVPRRGNTFTLSFVHEDPKVAMLISSKLASFFVAENTRMREQESMETSEFLEVQLEQTKRHLEQQEERIKAYKMQYLGELPQQMDANLNQLARLQVQEKSASEAIMRAEDRRIVLESEIAKLQSQPRGAEDPYDVLVETWETKQKQLRDLSTKYTESYPTIIQLRSEIEQLESKILAMDSDESFNANDNSGKPFLGSIPVRGGRRERAQIYRLKGQVAALDLEVAALQREKKATKERILSIEAKVSRLPQREQELISLTRDYENLKRSYDDLLKRKLQARVSQNLEEGQKGERYQILDPAVLPTKPFEPDRLKIMGLAFLGSLAFVFGGSLGLEVLDPTLRTSKEFKYFFDLPILASIPVVQDAEFVRKKRLRRNALLAGLISVACAVVAFLVLYQDRIRIILKIPGGIE